MSERLTGAEWDELHIDYANGNPDALKFNAMWTRFCHALDDIVDGEKLNRDGIVWVMMSTLLEMGKNKFFHQNCAELSGLIIQATNTYLDSCVWEKSTSPSERAHANVLRIYYDMVVDHVAFITSGRDFARLRYLSHKWRSRVWADMNSQEASEVDNIEFWKKDGTHG